MFGVRGRAFAFAFVATMLLVASPAMGAATRYASPTGDDSAAATCPLGDECDLQTAVEDVSVNNGDEVIVLPGDYIEADPLDVHDGIDLHGAAGQPRPRIISSAGHALAFTTLDPSNLSHLEIEHAGTGITVDMADGTVERVVVEATTPQAACGFVGGLVRDSVCWNSGTGAAVTVDWNGSLPLTTTTLRNVTAVASDSVGVSVLAEGGAELAVDAKNVIASGVASDARATTTSASSIATISFANSNFDFSDVSGSGTSVSPPGSDANQTAPPAFVDAPAADFHQAPGSPTIDAGTADPMLGSTDPDGDPRTLGAAPDIGADEFVPQPAANGDTFPPDTKILKGPRKRTEKRKAKFQFGGSEPGLTFECSLDGKEFTPCASPKKFRSLKRTRHLFAVRAVDAAGNRDPTPADRNWKVKKKKNKK